MRDYRKKINGKGILKKALSLALSVMTFATSFSCDYSLLGVGKAVEAKAEDLNTVDMTNGKWTVTFEGIKNIGGRYVLIYKGEDTEVRVTKVLYNNKDYTPISNYSVGRLTYTDVNTGDNYSDKQDGVTITIAAKDGGDLIKAITENSESSQVEFKFDLVKSLTEYEGRVRLYAPETPLNDINDNTPGYTVSFKKTGTYKNNDNSDKSFYSGEGYTDNGSFAYTGSEIKPVIRISTGGGAGIQYLYLSGNSQNDNATVSYSNDINAGQYTGTATITFHNGYYGNQTVVIHYSIAQRPITTNGISMSVDDSDCVYNGTGQEPSVVATDSAINKTLVEGTDYTLSYDNNINAGNNTATVTLTGKGNYFGNITQRFTVHPRNLTDGNNGPVAGLTITTDPQVYTGTALRPVPEITYVLNGNTVNLEQGEDKDFTVLNYQNNVNKTTESSKAGYTINFHNNYTGTLTQTFEISDADLTAVGNTVEIYDTAGDIDNAASWKNAGTFVTDAGDNSKTVLTATTIPSISFDPTGTIPKIRIKDADGHIILDQGTLSSYQVGTPNNSDSSKSWGTNSGDGWTMRVTGQGNYSGSFDVKFNVNKFSLGDGTTKSNRIQIQDVDLNADGGPKVKLQYVVNGNASTNGNPEQGTDYTVTFESGASAGASTRVVVAATDNSENYTGSFVTNGQRGYDLSRATLDSGSTTANVLIQYFDPFTGQLLSDTTNGITSNRHNMPYYGPGIKPHIVVSVRKRTADNNWGKWTESDDCTISTPTPVNTQGTSSTNDYTVTIKGNGNTLYGTNTSLGRYTVGQLDLRNEYKTGENGVATAITPANLLDITPDNTELTSYSDYDTIAKEVKLYVKPHNAGQEGVTAKQQDGTTEIDSTKQTISSWRAPDIWSTQPNGDNYYGNEVTTATYSGTKAPNSEAGIILDRSSFNGSGSGSGTRDTKQIKANGTGHYSGNYTIDLDRVDIGKSSDFEISPAPLDEYAWTGQPVFPRVGLFQKSTNSYIPPAYYYVLYENSRHARYVLTGDTDGNLVDVNSTNTGWQNGKDIITCDSGNDYTQSDPLSASGNNQVINRAADFAAEGDYTITIIMKTDSGTNSQTKLFGSRSIVDDSTGDAAKYSIKTQSVNDKISTTFNRSTVEYKGYTSDGTTWTANTDKPKLTSSDTGTGPKLSVTDKSTNRELTQGDASSNNDYTIDPVNGDDPVFGYPGKKNVRIIGHGLYYGTAIASYTVQGRLSNLADGNYYKVVGFGTGNNIADTITYYSDGTTLKDANGFEFDPSKVSIQTPDGTELDRNSYTITPDLNYLLTPGNHTITIRGDQSSLLGSYDVRISVQQSASALQWARGNENDRTQITLPYIAGGYRLGTGQLSLYSNASKSTGVSLDTNYTVTVTGADNFTQSDGNDVTPVFNGPGTYTINIKRNGISDAGATLTLSIKYDLSTAQVVFISGSGNNTTETDLKNFSTGYIPGIDPTGGNIRVVKPGTAADAGAADRYLDYGSYSISRAYDGDVNDSTFASAGTIRVTLTPVGNTSANFSAPDGAYDTTPYSFTYRINPMNFDNRFTATIGDGSYHTEYNGRSHLDEVADRVTVTYTPENGTPVTLTRDTDYTVNAYTTSGATNDQTSVGRQYILVTGKGNYAGSMNTASYEITPYDLTKSAIQLTAPDTEAYAGGIQLNPGRLHLVDSARSIDTMLTIGNDYSTTIPTGQDNSKANSTGRVNVTGKGNYTGTVNGIEFKISKYELSQATVTIDPAETEFTGSDIDAARNVTVKLPVSGSSDGLTLTRGRDYTVKFQKQGETATVDRPHDAGTYSVILAPSTTSTIIDTTGSQFTAQDTFTVTPMDITNKGDEYTVADAEWTGRAVEPDVKDAAGNKVDKSMLTYTHNVDACGTLNDMLLVDSAFSESELPTVTIQGTGNYTGTLTKHFRIGHPFSAATVSAPDLQYNGQRQTPRLTVTYSGANVPASAYDATYPTESTSAGVKTGTLTAKRSTGQFYGTKTFNYTITPDSGTVWGFTLTGIPTNSDNQYVAQYLGTEVRPGVRVYILNGNRQTVLTSDQYDVSYRNNNGIGTASVTVTPKNYDSDNCQNPNPLTFTIMQSSLSDTAGFTASLVADGNRVKYTGSALTPEVRVTYSGEQGSATLTQGQDYIVTYSNNINAGEAVARITGTGNFSGTRELPFTIYASFDDDTSEFTIPKQFYTGKPITSLEDITAKAGGNNLTENTDYVVSITSPDSFRTRGTATFTPVNSRYYEGVKTVDFEIGSDASMFNIYGVAQSYIFDHQVHRPNPVITDLQGNIWEVGDVSYQSDNDGETCVNAGNVHMTITASRNGHSVSLPYNYVIAPRNINTAVITPISDVNYNGKAKTPTLRITEGTRLLSGTSSVYDGTADFVVAYYNNTLPGKAQVSITGINNYYGNANAYFDINVRQAPQMIATAMPSGRIKLTWKKVSNIDGYRIFYTPKGGKQKQITVKKSKTSIYLTGLKRGVVYTVGMQSYVTSDGVDGYSGASVAQLATSTKKTSITYAKSTGKQKIKLKWKKAANATAYMVYRKTQPNGKWKRVKTTRSTSFTDKGLKSGRKYTYKIISYKQSGTKRSFSQYSKGKTVKAK